MLTFGDKAHAENGRAQAARSGAPAAPTETDMMRARKATIALNRQPHPSLPPPLLRHGGLLAHTNTNAIRFPGVQVPELRAARVPTRCRAAQFPHAPQAAIPAPAPAPPPGRTCPHKQEWCRQCGGCFRRKCCTCSGADAPQVRGYHTTGATTVGHGGEHSFAWNKATYGHTLRAPPPHTNGHNHGGLEPSRTVDGGDGP